MADDIENTQAETTEEETNGVDSARLYDLGFHITPAVPAEEVSQVVSGITEQISELGGSVELQADAEQCELAYPMEQRRSHGGEKKHFNTSYFGWLAVRMTPDATRALEEKLTANGNILRFLLTKTDQETVEAARERMREEQANATAARPSDAEEENTEESAKDEGVSEKEIDRAVDELTKQS